MNKYIRRHIDAKLKTLFAEKQILVITGMRRVGKTTTLKHLFNQLKNHNKKIFNLEDINVRKLFSGENYENIKLILEKEGLNFSKKAFIFIDEIQLLPNIASVIKYFYDEYKIKFIVTGSSSYYLKNRFTESLSGRKFVVVLRPLTFNEFLLFKSINKKQFTNFGNTIKNKNSFRAETYKTLYKEYIVYGGFPDVVLAQNTEIKKEILTDILNSYFNIDVASLASFSGIGILKDLLTLLTQRIGQKVNVNKLASALKINRQKVYGYLEFLKSTYIIDTISQKTSVDNKVSSDDKLYFSDSGLANSIASISEGNMFENSVYMNLVYGNILNYFQTSSGYEIDFILDNTIGIEVKIHPTQRDIANMKKRANSAKIKECYIVSLDHYSSKKIISAWDI